MPRLSTTTTTTTTTHQQTLGIHAVLGTMKRVFTTTEGGDTRVPKINYWVLTDCLSRSKT